MAAALADIFPTCDIDRQTVYLTDAQVATIETAAGQPLESAKIVRPYRASCDGVVRATAYFDVHRVRTLPETLLVVVDSQGTVQHLEVLEFQEPETYLATDRWLKQWLGKKLSPTLQVDRDIQGITGATLTARAIGRATRRVLAIHQTLYPLEVTHGQL